MSSEPDPELIQTRLTVWRALSELYLDTELKDADHRRIAAVLAALPYGVDELEEILRHEVHPACRGNLLQVAGEWAGFDDNWLRARIAPYLGRRRWWRRWPGYGRMVGEDWRAVRAYLAEVS